MNKDLRGYVKVYEMLDADTCRQAVEELDSAAWQTHEYYNSGTGESVSYETDLSISYDNVPVRERVMSAIWESLRMYMDDIQLPWFNSWKAFSGVRFNRYDVGQEMQCHCDHIHSLFGGDKGVPVLTVLGGLNDGYDGGELIFWRDERIELPAGSIMVFPSNFLFPHEVAPVKSGRRYSFVSWAY